MKIQIHTPEDLAQDTGAIAADMPLEQKIIHALRHVYDPELPVNIYDLGLIYAIDLKQNNDVHLTMTLTTPNCPVADKLPQDAARAVQAVEHVGKVTLDLVFEPKWSKDRMSDAAKLELNWFG